MNILQVIPALTKGGAERVVIELSNVLSNYGHQVTILCSHKVDSALNQGSLRQEIQVVAILEKSYSRPVRYFLISKWLLLNWKMLKKFDVIHCHLSFGLYIGTYIALVKFILRKKGLKLISTCHVVGVGTSFFPRKTNQWLSRFFDGFVLMTLDENWRRFVQKNKKRKYYLVQNGISPKDWIRHKSTKPLTKSIKIGTISRLQPERQPWLFLEVFASILNKTQQKVSFVLAGDGIMFESLSTYSFELGIKEYLIMPGLVNDPMEIFNEIDLYLALNVEETTGIAGLEAIFAGLPIVGLQLSNTYFSGKEDWIFSDQDVEIVAAEIIRLIEDSEQMSITQKRQFTYAEAKHTSIKMTNQYLDLYKGDISKLDRI
jgi:glycosyltransferase involved in cell wall biosynthesis